MTTGPVPEALWGTAFQVPQTTDHMFDVLPPLTKWVYDANRERPVYTRPMIGSELIMQRGWNIAGVNESYFGINFTSSLEPEELKRRARQALDKLRFMNPLIACNVEEVEFPRWVYTPFADRGPWLDLAFAVEDRGTSLNPDEFVGTVNARRLPYEDKNGNITFFRAYLLTTSEGAYGLYFHTTHAILDAGPGLYALKLMCEWICGEGMDITIIPSEEWKNLPADPITATGGPAKEWETSGKKLLQEVAEQRARTTPRLVLPRPSCHPSEVDMSVPPLRFTVALSEAQTAAIVAQTKKLGVSITALFYAANCLAHVTMNPVPYMTEVDYPCDMSAVALERYIKLPMDPKTHIVSSFSFMPLRFSVTPSLKQPTEKERLLTLTKDLQERFDRYVAHPCFPQLLSALAAMPRAKQDFSRIATNPWMCGMNNLGVVENRMPTQYGEITIDNICFALRVRTVMTLHMWTIHSKFHFCVQGSAVWGEECMKRVLEETIRIASLIARDAKL